MNLSHNVKKVENFCEDVEQSEVRFVVSHIEEL